MTDKEFDKLFEYPVSVGYIGKFLKKDKQTTLKIIKELIIENKIKESYYGRGFYEKF